MKSPLKPGMRVKDPIRSFGYGIVIGPGYSPLSVMVRWYYSNGGKGAKYSYNPNVLERL